MRENRKHLVFSYLFFTHNTYRLATWPVLATLEQRTRLELCLMECLTDLEQAMELGIGDPPSDIEIAAATWNMDRCVFLTIGFYINLCKGFYFCLYFLLLY